MNVQFAIALFEHAAAPRLADRIATGSRLHRTSGRCNPSLVRKTPLYIRVDIFTMPRLEIEKISTYIGSQHLIAILIVSSQILTLLK